MAYRQNWPIAVPQSDDKKTPFHVIARPTATRSRPSICKCAASRQRGRCFPGIAAGLHINSDPLLPVTRRQYLRTNSDAVAFESGYGARDWPPPSILQRGESGLDDGTASEKNTNRIPVESLAQPRQEYSGSPTTDDGQVSWATSLPSNQTNHNEALLQRDGKWCGTVR